MSPSPVNGRVSPASTNGTATPSHPETIKNDTHVLTNGGETSTSSSSVNGSHNHTSHGLGFATRALHVGSEAELSASGGVIPSIELSTTFKQSKVGVHKGFEYTRSANPSRLALERLLASLEGSDTILAKNLAETRGITEPAQFAAYPAALAFSSGSAATATVVSGLTKGGGHIVSVGDVYGGTSRYMLRVAGEMHGVETSFVDMSYGSGGSYVDQVDEKEEEGRRQKEDSLLRRRVESVIRQDTKLIWAETPTNPLLSLVPIQLIASIAKSKGIPLIIDNTFASPYYQNPLSLGASAVVISGTKYLNGFSDALSGCIITGEPDLLERFRFLQNANGNVPSPFDCWLVQRGIKTLALRSQQHGLNALKVARWLEEVAKDELGWVRDVRYPGLRRQRETTGEKRERELAWDQMTEESKKWATSRGYERDTAGGFPFSGMVSFHINSPYPASQDRTETAEKFLEHLQLFTLAESLGGVESLAELPLKMTHGGVAVERRIELGIDGELIRLSVGIEEGDDLIKDIESSLKVALGYGKIDKV